MTPYYADETVSLYVGDMREVLPALSVTADLVLADPPYGETSLPWDRWPNGWLTLAASVSRSLWCFGSMRMFLRHGEEFTAAGWQLSQDVIWEKNTGSGAAIDRFRRVHEHALHWYHGPWRAVHHDVPKSLAPPDKIARNGGAARRTQAIHLGTYGTASAWTDDGTRLARSVLRATSMRGRAIHPTQKPSAIIQPLLEYACPAGGLVIDPFAGSGSTLVTARLCGRRAIGIEADEKYVEKAAQRLSQAPLELT